MHQLKVYAVRKNGIIDVTLSGYLPNSCHSARVKDKYPGGGIVYIMDPGAAQVFIEEVVHPAGHMCLMMLVPWVAHVTIVDEKHSHVRVSVNGIPAVEVEVVVPGEQYRVVALTTSPENAPMGCFILPAGAPFLSIYSSFFGPATREECETWRSMNCQPIS